MNSQIKNGTVALLLCLFALGLFAISMKVTGPQLAWDGRDYAQVARQIARGEGQTTKVLYSYLLPQMADVKQWPNLFRPPFPVFLMSLGFRAFGVSELTAVLWSGLFYVGTVVMIFVCFQRV